MLFACSSTLIDSPCSEGEYVLRKLVVCFLLLIPAAGFAGSDDEFYEGLYGRGMTHFRAANYPPVFTELQIAAFGLVEQIERFETAQIYAAAAAIRVGNEALTRAALLRIANAERIQPRYRSIVIPDALRAELDRAASLLLTEKERAVLRVPK
jgi:hypothetical protein